MPSLKVRKMEDLEPEVVKELRKLIHFAQPYPSQVDKPEFKWVKELTGKEVLEAAKLRLAAIKEVNAYTKAKMKALDPEADLDKMQELLEQQDEDQLREMKARLDVENAR